MPKRDFYVVNHFMPPAFVFLVLRNFYCYIRKYVADPDMKKSFEEASWRDISLFGVPSFQFPSTWICDPLDDADNLGEILTTRRITSLKSVGSADLERMNRPHLFVGYKNSVFVYIAELFSVPYNADLPDGHSILSPANLPQTTPLLNEGHYNRLARLSITSSCICGRDYQADGVSGLEEVVIRNIMSVDTRISSPEY
jgi:hypothetical protein